MSDNRFELLNPTSMTVTAIVGIIRESYRSKAYLMGKQVLLQVQDYEEQYPYLILMDKTFYDAVTCLTEGNPCGGG